jgi:hypothetical protein
VVEQDNRLSIFLGRSRGQIREGATRIRRRVEGAVHALVQALACLAERAFERAQGALSCVDTLASIR